MPSDGHTTQVAPQFQAEYPIPLLNYILSEGSGFLSTNPVSGEIYFRNGQWLDADLFAGNMLEGQLDSFADIDPESEEGEELIEKLCEMYSQINLDTPVSKFINFTGNRVYTGCRSERHGFRK
jgi:hypothetical protein